MIPDSTDRLSRYELDAAMWSWHKHHRVKMGDDAYAWSRLFYLLSKLIGADGKGVDGLGKWFDPPRKRRTR